MHLIFRAENLNDAKKAIVALSKKNQLLRYRIVSMNDIPDVVVTITTKGFSREQVIVLLVTIPDSHLMCRTIQRSASFMGELNYKI